MNAAPALRLRAGDIAPSLVLPLLAAAALPAMSFSTWLTLTVAGLGMGMMLFLMASGLTLIFGLMDVLNFAHGAFITLGAYVAVSVLAALAGWSVAESWWLNLAALLVALGAAIVASGTLGFVFERVIIRRVYGAHLRQILVTVGGLIVAEQLIVALWGPNPLPLPKPASFRGSIRSEEHTSELQSPDHLVCRLLLEKKKNEPRITLHRAPPPHADPPAPLPRTYARPQ